MEPTRSAGLLIVVAGLALAVIGLLVYSGALSWFGRLPGDIRIERESVRFYIPITSMVLVSVVLSAIAWVVRRFL
ncbi:MAG: DUF2905 domain-containing protein [Thermoanaerobaculia bacterium]